MEFVVIAQYRARAGEEDRVAEALRKMVAPTRAEPGNLDYQVFRDRGQPSLFVLFERYADESAFGAHQATAHFSAWLSGQVLPSLEGRVRLDLVPLAAGGEALGCAARHAQRGSARPCPVVPGSRLPYPERPCAGWPGKT